MMISIGVDQLDCVMKLQPALDAFIAWAVHWKIKINPSKTKVITFERSNSDQINLAIAGDPIREVFTHCHLGLHLQRDLKWSTQIESILVKAEERLKILRYHRYNFNAKTLQNMYISYIRPKVEYSSAVWLGITKRDQERLEEINLSALRTITGCKIGTSHDKLYAETNIQPLRTRQIATAKLAMFEAFRETRDCRINRYNLNLISQANPYSIRSSSMLRPL